MCVYVCVQVQMVTAMAHITIAFESEVPYLSSNDAMDNVDHHDLDLPFLLPYGQ